MRVDLHNHTPLCKHAVGEPREYIQEAIKQGIEIYGFSDHAPNNFDSSFCMSFEQMQEYQELVLNLREEFKEKIDIRLGYEADWLPNYLDKRVLDAKVDYLIGSVHFIDKWGFDNPEFIGEFKNRDLDQIWQEYFDAIEQMAQSGYYNIVGHLDLMKVFNFRPKKDIRVIAKSALKAIKNSGMAVEINAAGLRKPVKELYPSKELLQECYALDIPITFGSDAHKVADIGFAYKEATELAREVGYSQSVSYKDKERQLHKF